MRIGTILLLSLVILVITMTSCAPSISQEEYDRLSEEVSEIQGELQEKITEAEMLAVENAELTEQYDSMQNEYEILNEQYDTIKNEYDNLQAQYLELSTENETEKETKIIIEEDLEQAIFELINQERENNGLEALVWGENLYWWAEVNSLNMATNKQLEYSDYGSYQAVYRATGYATTSEMAESVVHIWKNSTLYEEKILNSVMVHGTVAVYKSGDIYNITLIADYFR